jgi:hypothetical protein
VNQKYQAIITAQNLTSFILCSNDQLPLKPGDRRFFPVLFSDVLAGGKTQANAEFLNELWATDPRDLQLLLSSWTPLEDSKMMPSTAGLACTTPTKQMIVINPCCVIFISVSLPIHVNIVDQGDEKPSFPAWTHAVNGCTAS